MEIEMAASGKGAWESGVGQTSTGTSGVQIV